VEQKDSISKVFHLYFISFALLFMEAFMIRVVRDKIKEEIFFGITLALAIGTSLYGEFNPVVIDWHVISSLFVLMGFALVFEKTHLLDAIAILVLQKAQSERQIGFLMIFFTAILGMIITNDVALITIVPITLLIAILTPSFLNSTYSPISVKTSNPKIFS